MRVQHNITAMNSYRNYNNNTSTINKNIEKLSSGYKINRAGDNAAGLAISEKMRAQITGLEVAQKNAKDGISLVQTAEGALTEVHSMLNRMVELAEQSANGTFDSTLDRDQLQKEVNQLRTEIDRIADSSNFNGIKLLDGTLGGGSANATGAVFNGANVSLPSAAQMTQADSSKGGLSKTISAIDTTKATKDFLRIDGKDVTIDWANDTEAKKLAATLKGGSSATNNNADVQKSLAKQLEGVINAAGKDQGVSVSVSVDTSNGAITIKSNSKATTSEVSFLGAEGTSATNQGASVMNQLLGNSTAGAIPSINQVKNALVYDGRSIGTSAADSFEMVINGVAVNVTLGTAVTGGTTTVSAVATTLQTALRAASTGAIAEYNAAKGLTAGTLDTKSGLTGLQATDFTVEAGDNGNLLIKYIGDEDVNFSFRDVGDRSVASDLGLASGSSKSGGNQGLTLQIGDTGDSFNQLNVSISNMHANSMGIQGVDISSQASAASSMDTIKAAINYVSDCRGTLGATQNRLEHTINNLSVMQENIQDAESTIRDTDVADEMMKYTKNSILVQSAQAMLAQANQQPQGVLQLLQ